MSKRPNGVKMYPLTNSQLAAVVMQEFCLHKNVVQVPVYLIAEKAIDFDLMRRAIAEEIARNDSLRIFYCKEKKQILQYFLPEYALPEVPFLDFTGATQDSLMAWLKKDAATPVRYQNGESWRMKLFRTPDGRSGIYLNINHASMDLFAVFAFFKDLLEVYDALEKGTELPRPLSRFEDVIQKEYARAADQEKQAQHRRFYLDYFSKAGTSFYAGIDSMRQLNAMRKKKKDPNFSCVNSLDLLHDKSETLKCHISGEETARMLDFCMEQKTTMQSLVYMGMRTWLSRYNENTRDVYVLSLLNRRATLAEKRCGGCMMDSVPLRMVLEENVTFAEALRRTTDTSREVMRHADMPSGEMFKVMEEVEQRKMPGANTASMLFSVLPHGAFTAPEGWKVELGGVSSGRFCFVLYTLMIPSLVDNGMDCYYEYRSHAATQKELQAFHEGTVNVIRQGMANPEITLGQLLQTVE